MTDHTTPPDSRADADYADTPWLDPHAQPLIRMQPDVQNLGYAAGYIASTVYREGGDLRDVDLLAVQKHLVSIGNLAEEILEHRDGVPPQQTDVRAAVDGAKEDFRGVATVLADPRQSRPLLRQSFASQP